MTAASSLFLPEIGLGLVILGLFLKELLSKGPHAGEKMDLAIWGAGLFVSLALLVTWPVSGSAFSNSFRADALSTFLKWVMLFAGLGALVMVRETLQAFEDRAQEFSLLILIATLGAFFLASANDLITLFIAIEWLTISLYIAAAYFRNDAHSLEAGAKYLIMGIFSSAVLLYGISLIYGETGSIHLDRIREALTGTRSSTLLHIGFFMLIAGIGFKISAFPFQLWVPDVYQGAPTPVTAFLSVGSKTAGFAALFKILTLMQGVHPKSLQMFFAALSALTLLHGNLGAIAQTNMKRLLAYSSIGHAGYILMGIASGNRAGTEAALFYLAVYAVSNVTAFFVVSIANQSFQAGEISNYRGLARKSPLLAGALFTALLSLGGIPPLAGFFGKFLVLKSAVDGGLLWLAFFGAAAIPISLYYYLSVVKEMYLRESAEETHIALSASAKTILIALIILLIAIGIFQAPLFTLVQAAA